MDKAEFLQQVDMIKSVIPQEAVKRYIMVNVPGDTKDLDQFDVEDSGLRWGHAGLPTGAKPGATFLYSFIPWTMVLGVSAKYVLTVPGEIVPHQPPVEAKKKSWFNW